MTTGGGCDDVGRSPAAMARRVVAAEMAASSRARSTLAGIFRPPGIVAFTGADVVRAITSAMVGEDGRTGGQSAPVERPSGGGRREENSAAGRGGAHCRWRPADAPCAARLRAAAEEGRTGPVMPAFACAPALLPLAEPACGEAGACGPCPTDEAGAEGPALLPRPLLL